MQELIKKHETKLRFGLIGGLNTLLDFGLLFAFSSILGVPKLFANILSTSVAFVLASLQTKNIHLSHPIKKISFERWCYSLSSPCLAYG